MCLRAQSKMTMDDLHEGIEFIHARGKKIYLTLNLFMHNAECLQTAAICRNPEGTQTGRLFDC